MKPKTIGIIGGAGPLAGSLFFERILSRARDFYGCQKDEDFPKVFLLNFPFSEMLSLDSNTSKLKKELNECLQTLRKNGSEILAIACNTLHAFLNEKKDTGLVDLPAAIASELSSSTVPLVLCTSTSRQFKVHEKVFACIYLKDQEQSKLDQIIDQVLQKGVSQEVFQELLTLVQAQKEDMIVLGCTELSFFAEELAICNKRIIDSVEVAARKIVEKSFSKKRYL